MLNLYDLRFVKATEVESDCFRHIDPLVMVNSNKIYQFELFWSTTCMNTLIFVVQVFERKKKDKGDIKNRDYQKG